ncbi:chitinase [Paenibacillus sp. GSMTC-2017]|uniref:chitinase n=1 Tax=Paenibacillus sp. GSMTC-2017 TaxID=2794350 RepID=UPI0018D962AA|nr:chitinase [Paenibacillus sp. GSMTC-2017]MBH5319422.1 chitinase [Paenibacillus sp. GSMTC-2017]
MKTKMTSKVFFYSVVVLLVILLFTYLVVNWLSSSEKTGPHASSTPLTEVKVESEIGAGNETESEALDERIVGKPLVLTDSEVTALWDGIDPQFSPDKAVAAVQSVLPEEEYEQLFPYRIGTKEWHKYAINQVNYDEDQIDYYSYDNFITAVTEVANIKYKLEYRQNDTNNSRIFRLDKETKTETLIVQNANFHTDINKTVPIISIIVDFGTFLKEGTALDRKHELAAFLANISHETGGGKPNSPGGPLAWGLYWNEEIKFINSNEVSYVEPNDIFSPAPGKSYHGRGPIQLSWNYNYGLVSGIIYGTKDKLLEQPELIVKDGKLGFMTAILYWMTPHPMRPSAHDVMVGKWKPTELEISKGLTEAGFGITIMLINGNLEGNLDETDRRIGRRVGFYRKFTTHMGVPIEGEKVNTLGMLPF